MAVVAHLVAAVVAAHLVAVVAAAFRTAAVVVARAFDREVRARGFTCGMPEAGALYLEPGSNSRRSKSK